MLLDGFCVGFLIYKGLTLKSSCMLRYSEMVFLLGALQDLRHQILPSDQAKDGDFVVFVEDSEGSQNLIQG